MKYVRAIIATSTSWIHSNVIISRQPPVPPNSVTPPPISHHLGIAAVPYGRVPPNTNRQPPGPVAVRRRYRFGSERMQSVPHVGGCQEADSRSCGGGESRF